MSVSGSSSAGAAPNCRSEYQISPVEPGKESRSRTWSWPHRPFGVLTGQENLGRHQIPTGTFMAQRSCRYLTVTINYKAMKYPGGWASDDFIQKPAVTGFGIISITVIVDLVKITTSCVAWAQASEHMAVIKVWVRDKKEKKVHYSALTGICFTGCIGMEISQGPIEDCKGQACGKNNETPALHRQTHVK